MVDPRNVRRGGELMMGVYMLFVDSQMCFRRLPFQPPMKRREHSRFKRQMVHGAYDPLKLKDCTTKVENGQEKLLMYKKCFFMIGSWVVCYTYATWFSLGGLARTGKTYENYLVMREGVDFLRETKQQWRLGRKEEDQTWSKHMLHIPFLNIFLKKGERDLLPLHRVGKLIINSHLENRDYPQQEMTGVLMKSCILNNVTYKQRIVFAETKNFVLRTPFSFFPNYYCHTNK
ncbi:LOW QUALITY PROTEIN: hypothetical protein HID58_002587 [Brassica napus]|uniref:Uncharacterized protein n=1 Tax=Brassica napus TaxID=3708 RepID=A0ABQ8EMN5_BRANA|nr:LOW QUALITY PROTEIN: hypothetical protein HID58_002587 [Brassica napus]